MFLGEIANKWLPAAARRARIAMRRHVLPLARKGPTAVHLVVCGPRGLNRGDAVMSLAIPQILRRFRPDLNFVTCRIDEIRRIPSIAEQVGPCDLIVVGGGGLYGKWFSLENLLGLGETGVPVVLYGLGLNVNYGDSDLDPARIKTITELNAMAALTSVRDAPSRAFLGTLGIDATVIADPGAFYDPGDVPSVIRGDANARNIGINLPFHGFRNQARVLAQAVPAVRELLQRLIRSGARIHWLMHHPAERGLLAKFADLPLQVRDGGPRELLRAYYEMDMVVAGMLHSAIFSLNACVPFLALRYDRKQEAFIRLFGEVDEWSLPLPDLTADALARAADTELDRLAARRALLADVRNRLWAEHAAFAREVVALIDSRQSR